ncbi:hypothetical protein [Deinococcus pimensis]|uniref:hypothetical protein n=1 Tax=Deinococcus pimensis TaxID=309888 RepID=UPI000486561C|nr:hypothetical protein [Deinococcus pimensis]
MPLNHTDLPAVLPVLLAAFTAASGVQLVRQCMKDTLPRWRRVLAATLGAGVAGATACALLLEWLDVSALFLVAASAVVGWSGAGFLDVLGHAVESRLGIGGVSRRQRP